MVEMETLDGIVIDFGLNQEKFEQKFREKHEAEGGKHAEMSTTKNRKKMDFLTGRYT